jgi:DNA polymerase III alpha subunit (gram-positive type)
LAINNTSLSPENNNNVFINDNNNDTHNGTQISVLGTESDENLTESHPIDSVEEEPILNDTSNDLDLTKTIYIVFDLETTGFGIQRNNIFEIAAQIIDPLGIPIPDATFSSLINPGRPLSAWNNQHIIRLLPKLYLLDTLILSREVIKSEGYPIPDDNKLGTIYFYCKGEAMSQSHRAEADVQATCVVALYEPFWVHREDYIYKINNDGTIHKPTKKALQSLCRL